MGLDPQTKAGSLTIGGNLTTGSFTMSAGAGADKVLTTNASGVATWQAAATGATPGGTTGFVQFNDEGAFGSDLNLFWDNINKRLGIGTIEPTQKLDVIGGNVYIENKSNLGSELTIGGDMSNAGSWTANGGVVISGGVASWTDDHSTINQSISVTDGALYKLTYEVISYTSGNLHLRNYGWVDCFVETDVPLLTSVGTHAVYVVADPGGGDYIEIGNYGGTATYEIDNVSLKEVTGGDLIARGILTGGGTSGIKILGNGNVGIGTTGPTAKLSIQGSLNSATPENLLTLRRPTNWASGFYAGGAAIALSSESSRLDFKVDNTVDNVEDYGLIVMSLNNSGNVGIGTTGPNYKLDVSGSINMKKNYFLANNTTWKSLNYKMTQGEGGGAALVMCSQHTNAASGHVALYLIRATHSSTTSITTVYIGGNLDMFSFRNNNGILEVKGWDGGTGLTTAASCVVISQGSS